jgi:hypothetical protein
MRGILIIFTAFVLAGCASGPSLEDLEAQALVTGDWSLVERREAQIARRTYSGPKCPPGSVAYCRTFMADQRCSCVARDSLYTMFSGRR